MAPIDPEIANAIESLVGPLPNKDMAIGGAYEAADQFDRSVATWLPPIQSADADIIPNKTMADARVNDMIRNDGYSQSGANIHKNSIVGSMYMLNAKPELRVLGLDEGWQNEFQEEVEAKFTLGAESVNCWLDATRSMTFTGLIRLAIGVYAAAGEVLATAEWLRSSTRPFKTAIQMVDPGRLRTPFQRMHDNSVRGGIACDRFGAAQGFYIQNSMTQGLGMMMSELTDYSYVPAFKPWGRRQVMYIREQTRPHQTRGVSDMLAGLTEAKIAKQFRKVTLQNAVTGAMFAATIESELPSEAVYSQLGSGQVKLGTAIGNYGTEFLNAVAAYSAKAKGMQIDGVKIPHLFPGTKFQLRPVGTPGGVGQEFEQSLIRYVAALLGVSYEQLSKDYSKTNYSSAKAGLNETWKFMQARKKAVADMLATMIYMLWFEEMIGRGEIETMKYSKAPNYYDGLNAEAYCGAEWIGAGSGQIDELKETQAAIMRIKAGLSTYEIELGRMGRDWRKVFMQLEREIKERDARGIVMEESNAMNAASGNNPGETRGTNASAESTNEERIDA